MFDGLMSKVFFDFSLASERAPRRAERLVSVRCSCLVLCCLVNLFRLTSFFASSVEGDKRHIFSSCRNDNFLLGSDWTSIQVSLTINDCLSAYVSHYGSRLDLFIFKWRLKNFYFLSTAKKVNTKCHSIRLLVK